MARSGIPCRTEHPDTRLIHFHNGVDAFGDSHLQIVDGGWGRNGIAIQRDHLKAMAGQGQRQLPSGVRIEDAEQDPLPLTDADGFAISQGLVR